MRRFKYILAIVSFAWLAACGQKTIDIAKLAPAEAATLLRNELESQKVDVVQVGEDIHIIIPTHVLFYPQSPNFKGQAYPLLGYIADYLRQFRKIEVHVEGFTDATGSERRNQALSTQRAKYVADSLWHYGLDARLVNARGFGASVPIADNARENGRYQNRRIEIKFRMIQYGYV